MTRLQQRAKKLGVVSPKVTWGDAYKYRADGTTLTHGRYRDVTISGDVEIKLGEYTFLAALDIGTEGCIVRAFVEGDYREFWQADRIRSLHTLRSWRPKQRKLGSLYDPSTRLELSLVRYL